MGVLPDEAPIVPLPCLTTMEEFPMADAVIWSYSCRVVTGHAALATQLRLARDYGNQRIRNANTEWDEHRAIARRASPELAEAEDALETIQTEIAQAYDALGTERQRLNAARMRAGESPTRAPCTEVVDRIAALKTQRARVLEALKLARSAYNAQLKPAHAAFAATKKALAVAQTAEGVTPGPRTLERVHAEVLAAMLEQEQWPPAWRETMAVQAAKVGADKAGRANSPLYTSTSGLVDEATARAVSDSRKHGEKPWEKRQDGTGRVGGQVRAAPAVEDLLATTGAQLQMGTAQPYRQGWSLATWRLRIDAGPSPDAWVELSVLHHRPLPPLARVKYAWLKVSIGPRQRKRYDLQLVLDMTTSPKRAAGVDGACALHLAFRQVPTSDGGLAVRAGYVVGTDGLCEPVMLPPEVRSGIELADRLRGDADRIFDEARTALRGAGNTPRPAWVDAEIASLPQWRSHGRLARLAHHWLLGRYERDGQPAVPALITAERVSELWRAWKIMRDSGEKPYNVSWSKWRSTHAAPRDLWAPHAELDAWFVSQHIESAELRLALYLWWWREKDHHLKAWEDGARKRAELRRRDHYRVLWSRMAKRYRTLVVDDMKIAEIKRLPAADEDEGLAAPARLQLMHAAPGSLRELAVDRFGLSRTVKVSHKHTANTCSMCGGHFYAEPDEVRGRCVNGHRLDRDENAACNILGAGRERDSGGENAGSARGSESASETGVLDDARAADRV